MVGNDGGGEDGRDEGSANVGQVGQRTAGGEGTGGDERTAGGEGLTDGERPAGGDGEDAREPDGSLDTGGVGVEPVSEDREAAGDAEINTGRRWTLESHDVQFKLPPDASEDEAAAIAAAIGAQLLDERDEAEAAGDEPDGTWDGRRFAFAGRIEGLTGIPRRIPRNAPTDSWTATSRLDRI